MIAFTYIALLLSLTVSVISSPHPIRHGMKHTHTHHPKKVTITHHTTSSASKTLSKSSTKTTFAPSGTGHASSQGTPGFPTASTNKTSSHGTSGFPTASANKTSSHATSGFPTPSANRTLVKVPAQSNTTSSPSSTASVASGTTNNNFIRGANIGGWLLIQKQFNTGLFANLFANAVDQWTFDSILGAGAALESHYQSYFTESDVQLLKSYGFNALRIPIGFWAYDASGTPYYSEGIGKGADAYLEKAVGWAKAAGMQVWIDCHGSPGSQNGFDSSGHAGPVDWQQDAYQQKSITILEQMAEKYGAVEYQGTVIGLEIVNEPVSYSPNTFAKNQEFATNAYAAVKAKAANKDMAVVMHDAFEGPGNWTKLAQSAGPKGSFVIDTHLYQTKTEQDQALDQTQHIQEVCETTIPFGDVNLQVPVIVGEWTATTDICANADGTTIAGYDCNTSGCSCVSDPSSKWTKPLIDQMRQFVEAQLNSYEAYTSGYFMWSWTDPSTDMGSWSIKTGIEKGFIPNPINDLSKRQYQNLCSG